MLHLLDQYTIDVDSPEILQCFADRFGKSWCSKMFVGDNAKKNYTDMLNHVAEHHNGGIIFRAKIPFEI